MRSASIFDLHQDLISHDDLTRGRSTWDSRQTGWDAIEASSVRALVASTFPMDGAVPPGSEEANNFSLAAMNRYASILRRRPGWHQIRAPEDINRSEDESRGLLVHVEGVGRTSRKIEEMFTAWYEAGCRSIGLVWNLANGFAHGPKDADHGLTRLGERAMAWLDNHPVLVDLAHMSHTSFWDAMDVCRGPVLVSHANARSLCDNPRNLTDDQIRAIAERGGVIGVVFSSAFAGGNSVRHVAEHAVYIGNLVGLQHVAIGSDMGGLGEDLIPGATRVEEIGSILDELAIVGCTHSEIESVAWANAARFVSLSLGKRDVG